MNHCTFVGNVYKKPELRHTPNGVANCKFMLKVPRNYVDKDGKRLSNFIPIQAWNKTAENCAQYLSDDSLIAVTASYETDSYEKEGQKVYTHCFVARDIRFLDGYARKEKGFATVDERGTYEVSIKDTDLPF